MDPFLKLVVISFLHLPISFCWEYRWENPCDKEPGMYLPFCNTSLSVLSRSEDLVSRLSLEELISQLGFTAIAIPRLNISEYNWWMDGAHGIGQGVNWRRFPLHSATMFPQIISSSSSFNRTLWKQIGDAISTEGRAYFNYNASGLTYWDPNINIFRDCRWGRGQETPGEDPFVSAEYGINFVQGMQGNEKENGYLKLSVTCKHFDAYSFDNYDGKTRHGFNAIVTDYDLNDTYLVPIKYCVLPTHGAGSGVMCSYNAVNGIPSCANYLLLTNYLKKEWNFNGYITSDCGATDDILYVHKYTTNRGETCAAVYSAGMTQDCSNFMEDNVYEAIMNGYITIDDIKQPLIQNFMVLMRLGMFDKVELIPWHTLGVNDVNSPYHQQISLDAAKQSIILFKNNNILPLSINKINKIAVLGPNANNSLVVQGNYAGIAPFIINMLNGIESYVGNDIDILYNKGCDINSTSTVGFKQSVEYAQSADITILIMGIDQSIEREGHDRYSILLPGVQNQFINNISNVAYNNNHSVILVILSGGCVDIEQFENNNHIEAIIWSGYSGMFAGKALSDVIFGDFNPTGLTTQTWYKEHYLNEISMFDMGIRPNYTDIYGNNPGRGYRYYANKTNILYPFGYGLSYTQFMCDELQIFNSNMSLSIDVTNKGRYSGGAVILIYWIPNNGGSNGIPIKRLIAFGRINFLNIAQKYTNFNMLMYEQFFWSNEYQSGDGNFVSGGCCTV